MKTKFVENKVMSHSYIASIMAKLQYTLLSTNVDINMHTFSKYIYKS